jgi:hypothetical protein
MYGSGLGKRALVKKLCKWRSQNNHENQSQNLYESFEQEFSLELSDESSRKLLLLALIECCFKEDEALKLTKFDAIIGINPAGNQELDQLLKNWSDELGKISQEDIASSQNWRSVLTALGQGVISFGAMWGGSNTKYAPVLVGHKPTELSSIDNLLARYALNGIGHMGLIWLFILFWISTPSKFPANTKCGSIIYTTLAIFIGAVCAFPSGILAGKSIKNNFDDLYGCLPPAAVTNYNIAQAMNIFANATLGAALIQNFLAALQLIITSIRSQSDCTRVFLIIQIVIALALTLLINLAYVESGTELPIIGKTWPKEVLYLLSLLLNLVQLILNLIPLLMKSPYTTWKLHRQTFSRFMMIFMGLFGGVLDGSLCAVTFQGYGVEKDTATILAWITAISTFCSFSVSGPDIANGLRLRGYALQWGARELVSGTKQCGNRLRNGLRSVYQKLQMLTKNTKNAEDEETKALLNRSEV